MGGGAWTFLVGVVFCLFDSIDKKEPCLLNRYTIVLFVAST